MSRKRRIIDDELEPTIQLTSDGDLLLQSLLKKQLSKQTSLQQELIRKKEYVSSEYVDLTNFVPGENSLGVFQSTSKHLDNLEKLKDAGLTDEDSQFFLDGTEKGLKYLEMKHKNLDSDYIKQKLEGIYSILDGRDFADKASENTKTSRHQSEFMLSVKPNSLETQLLKFALENEKKIEELPSAMSNIKQIESDLMKSMSCCPKVNAHKIQKRLRTVKSRIDSLDFVSQTSVSNRQCAKSEAQILVKKSNWDVKVQELGRDSQKINPQKSYGCETGIAGNFYTIKEGIIVKLNENSSPLRSAESYEKLSTDEIRRISKFEKYYPGTPSNMLYMKNLGKLSQSELEQVFRSFNLQFKSMKVLNGRMRGQAFVEMECVEAAEHALSCLNGVILNKNPVIIEFGKVTNLKT